MPVTGLKLQGPVLSPSRKKRKIFILHASCGSGHRRAAEAVHAALAEEEATEVRTLDILEEAPAWYRKLYRDGYSFLVRKAPSLWDRLYRWCDVPSGTRGRRFLEEIEGRITRRFLRRIQTEQPDAVLCTHYLPLYLLGVMKARGLYRGLLFGVVTDYAVHRLWVNPEADGYAVATARTGEEMKRCGVPPDRVHVTGIPIHPIFGIDFDRREIRRRLEIPESRPLVLILSGGIGVGHLDKLLSRLRPLAGQVTFLASSPGNSALRRTLEKMREKEIPDLRIIGYVKNIHEYMAAADLLVTKPGGLTVTEALALRLPMILVDPIPGQEEGNARYLAEQGAALWAREGGTLEEVEGLLRSSERREELRVRMDPLARPAAARHVAGILLGLLRESNGGNGAWKRPCA